MEPEDPSRPMLTQCFYSDHDVWCGAAISRHMWSDQRLLISRDSEGGSEDLKRLFSLTWQWDQRPESASEPWPCATGQVRGKEEASGDAEAALPPVCVCACVVCRRRGAGRRRFGLSGNFRPGCGPFQYPNKLSRAIKPICYRMV